MSEPRRHSETSAADNEASALDPRPDTPPLPVGDSPRRPATSNDSYETYDVSTGTGHGEFQFTLYEIACVTIGVSLGLATSRWLSGKLVAVLLGLALTVGWTKLTMNDWEPRWAAVAWFSLLGAYLGALFLSLAQ